MIQKCSNWIIFREFLNNPLKKWHIRELSRKVKLAPTSVKLHLTRLMKENLILEKKDEIFKYFISNFDSEKFRFYKKINCLLSLDDSGIVDYINDRCSPDVIILFGSCAKGEDTDKSDVDIYIQSNEKKLDISKYEQLLGRKMQLFFSEDINKLPKELRNNILNGIKLGGYVRVF